MEHYLAPYAPYREIQYILRIIEAVEGYTFEGRKPFGKPGVKTLVPCGTIGVGFNCRSEACDYVNGLGTRAKIFLLAAAVKEREKATALSAV